MRRPPHRLRCDVRAPLISSDEVTTSRNCCLHPMSLPGAKQINQAKLETLVSVFSGGNQFSSLGSASKITRERRSMKRLGRRRFIHHQGELFESHSQTVGEPS